MDQNVQNPQSSPIAPAQKLDKNSSVVILLLLFIPVLGLLFMWLTAKNWPKWLKIVITLPYILAIVGIILAITVAGMDPFQQKQRTIDATVENTAVEFSTAISRYVVQNNALPCDLAAYNGKSLSTAEDCLQALIDAGEIKEGLITNTQTSLITIKFDLATNQASLCYSTPEKCQVIEYTLPTISPSPATTQTPTQAVTIDDNVKAAIESKNYSALDGYMNPTVNVLLHATECCGNVSKEAAIKQLDYLNEAKAPWNWDQNDPTIKKIKAEYPTTFGKGTIGISSNEMVVSYEVAGSKVVGIYLSATHKIMVQ